LTLAVARVDDAIERQRLGMSPPINNDDDDEEYFDDITQQSTMTNKYTGGGVVVVVVVGVAVGIHCVYLVVVLIEERGIK
jgi:hypothetical protein